MQIYSSEQTSVKIHAIFRKFYTKIVFSHVNL